MTDWLSFFRPPALADEKAAAEARTFHHIAWGVIVFRTVLFTGVILVQQAMSHRAIVSIVTLDLWCLFLLALNRYGWTRPASWLLVAGLMTRVTQLALSQGGLRTPGMSQFILFILMAGILLGETGALITTAATFFVAALLMTAEHYGMVSSAPAGYSAPALFMLHSAYMGIALVLVHLTTKSIRAALDRAQNELVERRVADKRLQLAASAGGIGVWEFDPATEIFVGDDRAFKIYGLPLPPDRRISRVERAKLIHPDDISAVEAAIGTIVGGDGAARVSYRLIRPDGQLRYIDGAGTVFLDHEGKVFRVIGMIMDVTERRLAEMQRETLLRDLKERVKEATALQNASVLMLEQSLSVPDLLQKTADLLPPAFQYSEIAAARIRYGHHDAKTSGFRETAWLLSQPLTTRDGTKGSIDVVYTEERPADAEGPFFAEERLLLETLAHTLGNALERRTLQSDLIQSQKLDAMGKLSGGVAHDFNNILTAILGFAEMLKMSLKEDDERREDAQQIIDASMRAAALTRQLLAFSRKQVLQPVVLDLNAILGDMEKMLRRLISEDIVLSAAPGAGLSPCLADRGQLEQVLLNLVVNARDAMTKGGKIVVSTANAELTAPEAERHGARAGRYVRLSVEDTGHGMSPDTLRRIFEPFFTTKAEGRGTGLGLATVHGVVTQSGGFLDVRSAVGQGTTFEVYLPAAERRAAGTAPAAAAAPGSAGKESVIIVDDDAVIRGIAHRLLTKAGYVARQIASPREALALLDEAGADLLITDVVMPEMGGYELAQQARAKRPGLRVLFMSGYLDRDLPSVDPSFRHAFLQKPFNADDFKRKVREILDASVQGK